MRDGVSASSRFISHDESAETQALSWANVGRISALTAVAFALIRGIGRAARTDCRAYRGRQRIGFRRRPSTWR